MSNRKNGLFRLCGLFGWALLPVLGSLTLIGCGGQQPTAEKGAEKAPVAASTPTVMATPESRPVTTPAAEMSNDKAGDKAGKAEFKSQSPIPDIMTRPFTKEEMDKALQQLPPEVRARIQGLSLAPAGVNPQASSKPQGASPSPTPRRK